VKPESFFVLEYRLNTPLTLQVQEDDEKTNDTDWTTLDEQVASV